MPSPADALLDGLNPAQREAVERVDSPLLIIAGPGSGKTRVITHRIAYLIRCVGIAPRSIAAVTFTNRAAREMRNRLLHPSGSDPAAPLLHKWQADAVTAGTFHSLCAMILRRDGEAIGIPREFVIMDDDDQMTLVKQAMAVVNLDPKRYPPRSILSRISAAKSQLLGPQGFAAKADGYYDEIVHRVFVEYQSALTRSHGVDFDDLLSRTVELFRQAPEVRSKYQNRFIHVMVDEFQDTNTAQYEIAREIAGQYRNLAVVGDPDQAIYSWRNADIRNILSFKKDYPDAAEIHLSQNYRSTSTILAAAQHVIRSNSKRIEQELFTHNEQGTPVRMAHARTEGDEAQQVVREVQRLMKEEGATLRDCVVTYRVNAQSRALEEACLRYGIPYKLIGGVRFYQRREVKDLLAYLRLLQDPYDEVSLTRIINVPTRGIGTRTVQELTLWARSMGVPIYTALQLLNDKPPEDGPLSALNDEFMGNPPPFDARQKRQLTDFLSLLNGLRESKETMPLPALIDEVQERSGYRRALIESDHTDAEDRLDNLRELRGMSAEFLEDSADESLSRFLEHVALVSDQDSIEEDEQQYLTLITLHQIKGLEYPIVFITGMEEGILPHMRSMDDPDQLEEERRIAYVGMTRARKRLYLFRALRRNLYGTMGSGGGSRFLQDIPFSLLETQEPSLRSDTGGGRTYPRAAMEPLTGGAAARVEPPSPHAGQPPFKAGEKVTHAVFGQGIVVQCVPRPNDYEVTVAFVGNQGVKRLLHSYGKLDKVAAP